MLSDATPFPWWLWLLAGMWAASLVIWQRDVLPRDWQRVLGIVVATYTVLLLTCAVGIKSWTVSRSMFWLAAGSGIVGGLILLRAHSIGGWRLGLWLAWCGIAGVLVQLGAEAVAIAALAVGAIAVWRMNTVSGDDSCGIADHDAWLIAALATVLLTAWIGTARHAITVERHRPAATQRTTALPPRENIRRWVGKPMKVEWGMTTSWQVIALAAVLGSSMIFTHSISRREILSPHG